MLKIIIAGVSISLVVVILFISLIDEPAEPELEITADIVMPIKVSRPGCDETDRCYIPSEITVDKGKTVTWRNEDSAFHSVTSGFYDEPTILFDSGYLDPFESFSYTFEQSGIYDYYCTLHPWMKAKVVVN